jgi:hypothetical protein
MAKSILVGRRIHIAGSISPDPKIASPEEVDLARSFVSLLVAELVRKGTSFVIPVDAEKLRDEDAKPICFDWLTWQTLRDNLGTRPADAEYPLAVAVLHHKTERQIPTEFSALWEEMRDSDAISIENVSHWNMNSKRMEAQAREGDILVTLGGAEGVLFLANLYHEAGKPVIPLNFALTGENEGSLRLFNLALASAQSSRFFRVTSSSPHTWVNRINWPNSKPAETRVQSLLELLEALEPPHAFVVRLLNPDHAAFADVEAFFTEIVQPVVESELGYKMLVVDGAQPFEKARMDQEIFEKLHRSSIVFADFTGARPNCFIELGYSLGRAIPLMLTVKEGEPHPFDVASLAALHWKTTGTVDERKEAFRKHWRAIKDRPAIVADDSLVW